MAKPWTEAEIKRMARWRRNHQSIEYIADRLGRTQAEVRLRLQQMPAFQIAEQRKWNAEELEALQSMIDEGCSISVMALRLGRTENSVAGKISTDKLRVNTRVRTQREHHKRLVALWQALVTGQRIEVAS